MAEGVRGGGVSCPRASGTGKGREPNPVSRCTRSLLDSRHRLRFSSDGHCLAQEQ